MTRVIVEIRGGSVIAMTADQPTEVLIINSDTGDEALWELETDTPRRKSEES